MTTLDTFVELVRDELGLPVTQHNIDSALENIPGWDSIHMLTLLMILERETKRRLSLPEMLDADSLRRIYELAVQS
jgi:acyl carrier protein